MKRQMRRLMLFVVVPGLFLTVACKGQCRQLSEKICDCQLNTIDKNSCLQKVSTSEGVNPANPIDENVCHDLLPQCDCRLITTPEGKARCGLARPSKFTNGYLDGGAI